MTDQTPPHDIAAEQAVLGALLLDTDSWMPHVTLKAEDFFLHSHQVIFKAICQRHERGEPADAVTLTEYLEANDAGVEPGYLIACAANTIQSRCRVYANIVAEKAQRRQLIEAGQKLINDGYNCIEVPAAISHSVGTLSAIVMDRAGPDPIDLFTDQEPPEIKPEWLPKVIADYCFDWSEVKGCPVDLMAMASIVTAAGALDDGVQVHVKPGEGWWEHACFWFCGIADPSMKKSAAFNAALAPLKEIHDDLVRRSNGEIVEWEREHEIESRAEKQRIRDEAKSRAQGLGYAGDAPAAGVPDKPAERKVLFGGGTMESLGTLLNDNPRGMLMYQDELAAWYGSLDAYSKNGASRERPHWLEAFDGKHNKDMPRTVGRGSLVVKNWSMGVMGTTQPEKAAAMVSKNSDDGFWQRFIVLCIPTKLRKAAERPVDYAAYERYCAAIHAMWDVGPGVVQMSPEAHAVRQELFAWIEQVKVAGGLPRMLGGAIGKWERLFPRLCLVYHGLDTLTSGRGPYTHPVTGKTAQQVSDMMRRYLLPHTVSFYGDVLSDFEAPYKAAKAAASLILTMGLGRITRQDFARYVGVWADMTDWDRRATVQMLLDAGWLLAADTQRRRNPGEDTAWTVNQRVHALFADRARREVERRAVAAEGARLMREAMASAPGVTDGQ